MTPVKRNRRASTMKAQKGMYAEIVDVDSKYFGEVGKIVQITYPAGPSNRSYNYFITIRDGITLKCKTKHFDVVKDPTVINKISNDIKLLKVKMGPITDKVVGKVGDQVVVTNQKSTSFGEFGTIQKVLTKHPLSYSIKTSNGDTLKLLNSSVFIKKATPIESGFREIPCENQTRGPKAKAKVGDPVLITSSTSSFVNKIGVVESTRKYRASIRYNVVFHNQGYEGDETIRRIFPGSHFKIHTKGIVEPSKEEKPQLPVIEEQPKSNNKDIKAGLINYPFPLRDDCMVHMHLPVDLTLMEAEKLKSFLGVLAVSSENSE